MRAFKIDSFSNQINEFAKQHNLGGTYSLQLSGDRYVQSFKYDTGGVCCQFVRADLFDAHRYKYSNDFLVSIFSNRFRKIKKRLKA